MKTTAKGVCACLRGRGGYLQSGRCLGEVWQKGAKGIFEGHALSISDVVEFSDEMASRYFYVEPKGFAEITFKLE